MKNCSIYILLKNYSTSANYLRRISRWSALYHWRIFWWDCKTTGFSVRL